MKGKSNYVLLILCLATVADRKAVAQPKLPIHFGAAWNALWNGKPQPSAPVNVNVDVTRDSGMSEYVQYLRQVDDQKRADIQKAVERRMKAIAKRNQEIVQEKQYAESHQAQSIAGIDFEFATHTIKSMSHKSEIEGNKDAAVAACQRQNSNEFVDLMQVDAYRKVIDTMKIDRVSFSLIDNRNGSRGDKIFSDLRGAYLPLYSIAPSVTSYFASSNWLSCIRNASTQEQAKSCCAQGVKHVEKDSFENAIESCQEYWNPHGYGGWCESCFSASTKTGKKSLASTHLEITGLLLADPEDATRACVSVTEELVAEFEILAKKYNVDTTADPADQE